MAYEYYDILGIDRGATDEAIKRAYRKKAMELHPDRHNGDKTKEAEFKKLAEAYSVLSDQSKRAHYDRFGTMEGSGGGFSGGFGDMGGFSDIFETFFGGGFGASGGRRRDVGEDIELYLSLSFEEAVLGAKKEVSFAKRTICPTCHGTGAKTKEDLVSCSHCKGSGQIRQHVRTVFWVIEQASVCVHCGGSGKTIRHACETCHGKKFTEVSRTRSIDIPAGIDDAMTIKLRHEWHEWQDGSGDLFIHFRVPSEFEWLSRDDLDLHFDVKFDPVEFVLGTKREVNIPILGKKTVELKAGTEPESELKFKGEGLPSLSGNRKGNAVLHLVLEIPKKLTKKERELYEAIAREKNIRVCDGKGIFGKLF